MADFHRTESQSFSLLDFNLRAYPSYLKIYKYFSFEKNLVSYLTP